MLQRVRDVTFQDATLNLKKRRRNPAPVAALFPEVV
jgi:hypothetical protein